MLQVIGKLMAFGLLLISASTSAAYAECGLKADNLYSEVTAQEVMDCTAGDPERVHARDNEGNTPLHLAMVFSPETEIIRFLISFEADLEALNANKETPIHTLAAEGNVPSHVAAFSGGGGDINDPAPDDTCKIGSCATRPIHRVARRPEAIDMLRAFLAAGADATAKDPSGRTPLHYAAEESS